MSEAARDKRVDMSWSEQQGRTGKRTEPQGEHIVVRERLDCQAILTSSSLANFSNLCTAASLLS